LLGGLNLGGGKLFVDAKEVGNGSIVVLERVHTGQFPKGGKLNVVEELVLLREIIVELPFRWLAIVAGLSTTGFAIDAEAATLEAATLHHRMCTLDAEPLDVITTVLIDYKRDNAQAHK